MRAVFGIVSLLIVLAVVGSIAKKQLQATSSSAARNALAASQAGLTTSGRDGATLPIPGGMPGAEFADPNAITVPQQAQALQQKARNDTARALQQGADRNQRADR